MRIVYNTNYKLWINFFGFNIICESWAFRAFTKEIIQFFFMCNYQIFVGKLTKTDTSSYKWALCNETRTFFSNNDTTTSNIWSLMSLNTFRRYTWKNTMFSAPKSIICFCYYCVVVCFLLSSFRNNISNKMLFFRGMRRKYFFFRGARWKKVNRTSSFPLEHIFIPKPSSGFCESATCGFSPCALERIP